MEKLLYLLLLKLARYESFQKVICVLFVLIGFKLQSLEVAKLSVFTWKNFNKICGNLYEVILFAHSKWNAYLYSKWDTLTLYLCICYSICNSI